MSLEEDCLQQPWRLEGSRYSFRRVLSKSEACKIDTFEKHADKFVARHPDRFPSFFFNLQHNPEFNTTLTSIMPTLTRQSNIYRLAPHEKDDRLMHILEFAAVFMFAVPQFLPADSAGFDRLREGAFSAVFTASPPLLSHTKMRGLLGNCINVNVLTASLLYILMTTKFH